MYVREEGASEDDRGDIYLLDDYPASRVLLRAADGFGVQRMTDPGIAPFVREKLIEWGWRTWIELPLVVNGRSVGLIEMADYTSARRWAQRDIDFCRTIAGAGRPGCPKRAALRGSAKPGRQGSADRRPEPPRLLRAARAGARAGRPQRHAGRRDRRRPRRLQGAERHARPCRGRSMRSGGWRPRSARRAGRSTSPGVSAATSSRSSCPTSTRISTLWPAACSMPSPSKAGLHASVGVAVAREPARPGRAHRRPRRQLTARGQGRRQAHVPRRRLTFSDDGGRLYTWGTERCHPCAACCSTPQCDPPASSRESGRCRSWCAGTPR